MSQGNGVTVQKVSFPHGTHQVVGNLFLPPASTRVRSTPPWSPPTPSAA